MLLQQNKAKIIIKYHSITKKRMQTISISVLRSLVHNKNKLMLSFLLHRQNRYNERIVKTMDFMLYSQDFQINEYFNTLPPYVRQAILDAYGEISTLGELKECANHIMNSRLY